MTTLPSPPFVCIYRGGIYFFAADVINSMESYLEAKIAGQFAGSHQRWYAGLCIGSKYTISDGRKGGRCKPDSRSKSDKIGDTLASILLLLLYCKSCRPFHKESGINPDFLSVNNTEFLKILVPSLF